VLGGRVDGAHAATVMITRTLMPPLMIYQGSSQRSPATTQTGSEQYERPRLIARQQRVQDPSGRGFEPRLPEGDQLCQSNS
jgi:hypothetical protein